MACIRVQVGEAAAIVSLGGPERKIRIGARVWYFEMHGYLGPNPINKRTGNGVDGTKAFWEAVTLWAQQGERVDDAGFCVYQRPPKVPMYRLSRGNCTTDAALAERCGVVEPCRFIDDPNAANTGTPSTRETTK